jgi:tetratricopeptide (TPR) repeat protein
VRQWQTGKVIFLHGYWRRPESVILDWKSYEQIARDEDYREDLAAFWRTNTWIYVGCGVNGLSDPDFGLLLERYGDRARKAEHWDFCLALASQRDEFQAYFDEKRFNIKAISFGDSHDDLPEYLLGLLPGPKSAVGTSPVLSVTQYADARTIPKPPALYAEPDYIGSHNFVGREAELQILSDWALPADPTNLLLFEAIGGNGKSMLTWHWTKYYSTAVRSDWAGRFWYSFYEKGAIMADFCQRALAYMTGQPREQLRKKKTVELKELLIAELHAKPWLLILDGLERVLVAYHRIDAAEVPDEEANAPTDKIANRNPCDAIRDEDNDLLRALAAAAPSKILVSSRLTPRVLLNPSGQAITGAKRITLPGLRPPDAEKLLRSCGVRKDSAGGITGDSGAIQSYLTANCDNHPLVIGILGGLIANYLPNRDNFDAWVTDPQAGAALNLASLDLVQRRNHILRAALDLLPPESQALLSTLALLTDSVDYETLKAFNPHLPPEPEAVKKPQPPEKRLHLVDKKVTRWEQMSDEQKFEWQKQYEADLAKWQDYEKAVQARLASVEFRSAPKLQATVKDLEQRGLLQWDGRERKYNLHPVVRGVASGGMAASDRERHGQRVVDHFTAQPHRPYEEAETMEDVRSGLHVVRTLLKLGHFQQAADAYSSGLANALSFNLEAYAETLSLLRPFFPAGWGELPKDVTARTGGRLANCAGGALDSCGELTTALTALGVALRISLTAAEWTTTASRLRNIALTLISQNRLAQALNVNALALEVANLSEDKESIFKSRLWLFADQSRLGQWAEANATWRLLDSMGRSWTRGVYQPGNAEKNLAGFHFWQGTLQEEHLTVAERLVAESKLRNDIRDLHQLRGDWRLEQGEWALAAASYQEAVRLARERSLTDADSETGLALAKHHLRRLAGPQDRSELAEARHEAERLAQLRNPAHRRLAQLWLALGDAEQAKHHAIAAYKWAWADGEPYVNRYELTKTTELLQQMQVPIPNLAPYDAARDEPLPWEEEVRAAIERLRAEKESEKQSLATEES